MRKKSKKNPLFLMIILVLIFLIASGIFYIHLNKEFTNTRNSNIVSISGGYKETFEDLENKGIIANANFTYYYVRFIKKDFNLIAGNFEIPPYLKLDGVLDYLSNPNNLLKDETTLITFIEGDWAKHIARKISDNTNIDYQELIDYWNDKEVYEKYRSNYPFLSNEPIVRNTKILLEGYLFPDTYEFYKNTTKQEVTEKILDRTLEVYNHNLDDIKNSGMSFHDILTLASIVQYESGYQEDMNTIAGVFFNRLERGIKLESSVTRCYVIGQEREDDWRKCEYDLDYNDPYDTYQNQGLPPGPILNPGEAAILAVLKPEKTDFLFFVGDLDSKTYFAKTLQEHEHNYCKYVEKTCE